MAKIDLSSLSLTCFEMEDSGLLLYVRRRFSVNQIGIVIPL
jgi:hypothetical protein